MDETTLFPITDDEDTHKNSKDVISEELIMDVVDRRSVKPENRSNKKSGKRSINIRQME